MKTFISILVFAICISASGIDTNNAQNSVELLNQKLTRISAGDIVRLEVYYFPEDVETQIALKPEDIEHQYWIKTSIRRFQDSQFRSALIPLLGPSTFKMRSGGDSDTRWGCVFYDDKGTRILSMYSDKFGRGEVDGIFVRWDDKLLDLFRTKFAIE